MTGLQSQRSINCLGGDYMKRLNVTMMCMAVYNSYIDVPDNLTFEEAIDYANGHTGDISSWQIRLCTRRWHTH